MNIFLPMITCLLVHWAFFEATIEHVIYCTYFQEHRPNDCIYISLKMWTTILQGSVFEYSPEPVCVNLYLNESREFVFWVDIIESVSGLKRTGGNLNGISRTNSFEERIWAVSWENVQALGLWEFKTATLCNKTVVFSKDTAILWKANHCTFRN